MTALPIQSIDAELEAAHQEQLGLQLPEAATSLRITYVRPIKVHPDPEQPRKEADAELRASIRESGILEPISIRHADPRDGACADCGRSWHEIAGAGEYILVTGERRWRGAREVMETIPAIIRDDLSARAGERRITQLTENTAKKPLTAVEEAIALEKIRAEEPSLSITRLGMRTGLPRQVVSDRLAALRHPRFRPLFVAGVLSSSQAVEAARFAEYSETDHDRAWAKLLAMHPGMTVEEIFAGLDVRDFRGALDVAYQVSARAEGQMVIAAPMACARCGCTEERACEGGCHWVGVDVPICSACIRDDEEVRHEPCQHCDATGEWNGERCDPCYGSGSLEVLAQRPPSISAMRAEQREDDAGDAAVTAPDPADATVQHAPRGGEEGQGTEPPARGEAVERESAPEGAWGTSSSAPTPGAVAPAQPDPASAWEKHSAVGKSTDPTQLADPLPVGLFAALRPLLAARHVSLGILPLEDGRMHVLVMPAGLQSLSVRGTIEELDTELAGAIAAYIAAGPAEHPVSPAPTAPAKGRGKKDPTAKRVGAHERAAAERAEKRAAKKASKPAAKKSTTKKAPARKAAPAKKPASSTAKRRGKAVPEAAPQDANTQEARAVEPVEEGQASVEAATAVSGEAVTGANETLGDVGGEQSGSSTGPSDTAPALDEFSARVLESIEKGLEAAADDVQPYYRAYMHASGFTDAAELRARDVNNVPFMQWLNIQRAQFRATCGLDPDQPFTGAGEGDAFGNYLASRWPAPVTTTPED